MNSIAEQISKLNPWFYEVNIRGNMTIPGIYPLHRRIFKNKGLVDTNYLINRQQCRSTLLIDEVTERYDFTNKSLLDLGCNCAYWSSIYLAGCGAKSLVGIDGRELFIKQADLVLTSLGVRDRAQLILGNVEEMDYTTLPQAPFDFVLCAGILYHTKSYEGLLSKISEVNTDCLVIDTRVRLKDVPQVERRDLYFNAIRESANKITPSKERLLNILEKNGYESELIPPKFKTIRGVDKGDNYNIGNRIFLFCRKLR